MNFKLITALLRGTQMPKENTQDEEKVDTQYMAEESFKLFVDELNTSIKSFADGMRTIANNQVEIAKCLAQLSEKIDDVQYTLDDCEDDVKESEDDSNEENEKEEVVMKYASISLQDLLRAIHASGQRNK